jgi:hypothetical protein
MRKIICVDLDGTILTWYVGKWDGNKYGKPVPGAKEFLKRLIDDGWWVIIYTCRGERNKVSETLLSYGIEKGLHYSDINRRKDVLKGTYKGKIGADVYLDDRAICFEGNWERAYNQVTNFKTWESR